MIKARRPELPRRPHVRLWATRRGIEGRVHLRITVSERDSTLPESLTFQRHASCAHYMRLRTLIGVVGHQHSGEMMRPGKPITETCCLAVIILSLAGCLVVPIPALGPSAEKSKYEASQFVKGVTSRTEVIKQLGDPKFEMLEPHIIGYPWEEIGGYLPWFVFGGYSGAGGVAVATRPEYFFVAFDKNDYVSAWGVYGQAEAAWIQPVQEYARAWAQNEGLAVPEPAAGFVAGNVPQRQAVVYIYRPSGFAFPFRADPAVLVDGKLEAELRKGTYIAVPLSVGKHVISVDPLPHYNGSVPPEQRPVRSISLDTAPNTKYFVSFRVGSIGFETELMIQSEQEAMPVLENMTRAK